MRLGNFQNQTNASSHSAIHPTRSLTGRSQWATVLPALLKDHRYMPSSKIDRLERTILELGVEIHRVKHRVDEVDRDNRRYKMVFASLRKLLDEKGVIGTEDFDDMVDLDLIMDRQAQATNTDSLFASEMEVKKLAN